MQQRTITGEVGLGGGLERVFGNESQVVLLAPGLEQILEGLTDNGFAAAAAGLLDDVQLLEIVVDENLTHGFPEVVARF